MNSVPNHTPTRRAPPRHPVVWWSRIKVHWPLLIWLAAASAAIYFFYASTKYGVITGNVEVISEDISPPAAARLVATPVKPGDRVQPGEVVAVLDTTLIDAEIAAEKALYQHEMGTLDAYQWGVLQADRQYHNDIARAGTALDAERLQMDADAAELGAINAELKRLEELLALRLVDAQALSRLRTRQAALQKTVELYPDLIRAHTNTLADAQARYAALEADLAAATGSPTGIVARLMDSRRQLYERRLALLELRRAGYTLRAMNAGTVSRVLGDPGDSLSAGAPLIRIVSQRGQLIGFMPETEAHDAAVKMKATVVRNSGVGPEYTATVVTLGPEIDILPARISPVPGRTISGRRIMLKLDGPTDLLPGESVRIQLEATPWEFLQHKILLWRRNAEP